MAGQRDELMGEFGEGDQYGDFGREMQEEYNKLAREEYSDMLGGGMERIEPIEFDQDGIPRLGEYGFGTSFSSIYSPFLHHYRYHFPTPTSTSSSISDIFAPTDQSNPHLQSPAPLFHAKELLKSSTAPLAEVILLLEAAIQQNDLGRGGYEAWILLGEICSMDEREESAIRALSRGVEIASASGGRGEVEKGVGLVSLAIAYTNESYEKASYTMLSRWLQTHYPQFLSSSTSTSTLPGSSLPGGGGSSLSTWALKESVTDAYMLAARSLHERGINDPDVQIGLGVLLYTGGDYERAADCFGSALQGRPDVSSLSSSIVLLFCFTLAFDDALHHFPHRFLFSLSPSSFYAGIPSPLTYFPLLSRFPFHVHPITKPY